MKLTQAFLPGIVALLFYGCAPAAIDIDAARASLAESVEAYNSSMTGLNPQAAAGLYGDDVVVIPKGKAIFEKKQAAEDYLVAAVGNPGFQASFETLVVDVSKTGESGYSVALVTVKTDGPDGEPIVGLTRDVHFLEKSDTGEWRIVLDTWNAAPTDAD